MCFSSSKTVALQKQTWLKNSFWAGETRGQAVHELAKKKKKYFLTITDV